MVCVSKSRVGRGGLTQFCINFLRYRTGGHFRPEKKSSRNGSGSHVLGKTSRHRPPTALKLGSKDSQRSGAYAPQVGWRFVSYEAKTRGSGEVLCANSTFFLVYAANRNDPSIPTALLAGLSTMKGKPVLFSVFWDDNNSWPKTPT